MDGGPGTHPGGRLGAARQLRRRAGELVSRDDWLLVLGPSATWALRRIAAWLATAPPSGRWIPVEPLARSLGLGSAAGRNCLMRRTLARLVDFRMAEIDKDRDVLVVRTVIPPLTDRQVARLPEHLVFPLARPASQRRAAMPQSCHYGR